MRFRFAAAGLGLVLMAAPMAVQQGSAQLNPMVTLHKQGLPVFGISHPSFAAGRGGGEAPVLADVVKETVGYRMGDYMYTSGTSDAFVQYVTALRDAGGSVRTHPFIAKVGVHNRNAETTVQRITNQLDAGHVGIMMEAVESAAELRQGIAAMRFRSQGGTRPESNLAFAASYWGLSEAEYKQKADLWPLNPNGELILWAIIESLPGIEHVREIAATPGLGVLWAGWGTLGGVFSGDPEGRQGAADKILAACKEFKVACGFPASNPADVERLMAEGWDVFVMQGYNDAGRDAVVAGRRLSGRPSTGP